MNHILIYMCQNFRDLVIIEKLLALWYGYLYIHFVYRVQAIGWPPIKSYRKNNIEATKYKKVSVDGAPYLRKIDLKQYKDYNDLLCALEEMFKFKAFSYGSKSDYKQLMKTKMEIGCWLVMFHGICSLLLANALDWSKDHRMNQRACLKNMSIFCLISILKYL